jgi:SAM-dependent methyltransferase
VASHEPENAETGESSQAFVESAIDAFELARPLYQFGFCPKGDSRPWARLRGSLPEGADVDFGWVEEAKIARLPIPDGAARTVLCVDALGRVFEPRRAVNEMVRILSPGGALLICASGAAAVAGREPASWRLTPRGLERLLSGMDTRLVGWQGGESFPHTVYGIGFKPPLGDTVLQGTNRFLDRFSARLDQLAGRIGWRRRLRQFLAGWVSSDSQRRRWRDYYQLRFAVHFSVDRKLTDALLQGCLPSKKTGTRLDLTE